MFDASRFIDSMTEVLGLLHSLGAGTGWSFGTLHFELRLGGRGVPSSFSRDIIAAEQSGAVSAHARMANRDILKTQLPDALRSVRAHYAQAGGGLPRQEWMQADIEFCLANGGSVALNRWQLPHLRDVARSEELPFPAVTGRPEEMARRLSAHAALDLSGPLRTYEVARRGNSALPFRVAAPDSPRALARLSILMDCEPSKWTHLREVHDADAAADAAQSLIRSL